MVSHDGGSKNLIYLVEHIEVLHQQALSNEDIVARLSKPAASRVMDSSLSLLSLFGSGHEEAISSEEDLSEHELEPLSNKRLKVD